MSRRVLGREIRLLFANYSCPVCIVYHTS